jgi:hypothetical protein
LFWIFVSYKESVLLTLLVLSDVILDDDFLDIDKHEILCYLNIGKEGYIDPYRTVKVIANFNTNKLIFVIFKVMYFNVIHF